MSVVSSSFRARVRSNIEGPVAAVFVRTGLSPNALTLIGFGIAVIGAWLAADQSWLFAGLVVAFGAVFDLFDGALARATNKVSKFGAFLDSTSDRAGEAVVYIGIALGVSVRDIEGSETGGQLFATAAILAMVASFMVSYTRAKSESLGFSSGTGMANVGVAPREVRTVLLVLGLLLTGLSGGIGSVFYPTTGQGLPLLAALTLISVLATLTTLQRIYFVYQQSKSEPKQQEVRK
jgi:CDP-diacylglycerol--glycerol-3-phosphate 3-phosphatidyltransferase